MRAWTFQDHRQKAKLGSKAPWSIGWIDPEGRRRSKRIGSKSMAEKQSRKIEGQLAAGVYQGESRKQWKEFRAEYEAKILSRLEPDSQRLTRSALDHLQRISRPVRVDAIKTATIDDFVAKRRLEPGKKRGSILSPATVNNNLRHIKAVLNVAKDWGYLPVVPIIR